MTLPILMALPPRFHTLAAWLAWQEGLHVREIDLGLDRVRRVFECLGLQAPRYCIISVGGTNGKGSSVAMLDAILRAAEYRTATYTSPHLMRYNERIRIGGAAVSDAQLCASFQRVDDAREGVSLTYFEFGTLAALDIFARADLDVVVLEVGLGGRLDAVNLVDADAALIAAIGIDHVEWLGPNREEIAREKAGIFRPGRPAICSDREAPGTLARYADRIGAPLHRLGRDYDFKIENYAWEWRSRSRSIHSLPWPSLRGDYQIQNAAGVLMVLEVLSARIPVTADAMRQGLSQVRLAGRFQVIPGPLEYVLDVAHNPQAAGVLGATLRRCPAQGETHAIIGMLKDKDSAGVFAQLADLVEHWHLVRLPGARGSGERQLALELSRFVAPNRIATYEDIDTAFAAVNGRAKPGDRVLVTGSFLTVAGVMQRLEAGGGHGNGV
ncbi:MAG: bifunctional tetrahydrofolate synthase/dihydrofolate synthase [Gammaproteobacteria bacterium]